MSFVLLGILNSQAAGGAGLTEAHELISETVVSSAVSSITLSNIPQQYKWIEIRTGYYRDGNNAQRRLNNNGNPNYQNTILKGLNRSDSTNDNVVWNDNMSNVFFGVSRASYSVERYGGYNTTNRKTSWEIDAGNVNDLPDVGFGSGHWSDTSVVNEINIVKDTSGTINPPTRIRIYGVL